MPQLKTARPGLEALGPRELLSATPLQMAATLTHSAEHYRRFVAVAYQSYLDRRPDAAGLTGWVRAMQSGLPDERLESSFIGSVEYIKHHGGAGAGWVRGMYRDLLRRAPARSEVDGWVGALRRGATPGQVADGIAASTERDGLRVRGAYSGYLGRPASQAEVDAWVNAFGQGVSQDDLIAVMVSSPEYFNRAGGQYDVALWLTSAYRTVLGRMPSQGEVAALAGQSLRVVGSAGRSGLYFADANNQVYRLAGTAGQYLGQGAVAPDGSFWFHGGPPGTAARVYRAAGGRVAAQSGTWTDLLGVSADGKVWVVNGARVATGNGRSWRLETSPVSRAIARGAGIGARVVQFAQQHIGGTAPAGSRGECTDVVIAALQAAGAKTTLDFGVGGPNADYVWGYPVADRKRVGASASALQPVRAGDVIQFRDVTLVSKVVRADRRTWTFTSTLSHHTVIIEAVLGPGRYRILEQNWLGGAPEGRVVRRSEINLNDVTRGRYWIYQPVAL
jgi:hypothetical protein